jgi:Fe-S-cluster containining protein
MTTDCLRCGACCRSLIVEADLLDALREPRIAAVCGLPIPASDACSFDDDEDGEDPWNGRVAILSPRRTPDGHIAGCAFLDAANRCTIYPTRPNICVAFAPGSRQCREVRGLETETEAGMADCAATPPIEAE